MECMVASAHFEALFLMLSLAAFLSSFASAAGRPQDGPKIAQDGPKLAPRWPQDGPKMAQDGPKVAQARLPKINENHLVFNDSTLGDFASSHFGYFFHVVVCCFVVLFCFCGRSASRWPQMAARWTQMARRRPQGGPRWPQGGPRRATTEHQKPLGF